MREMEQVKTSIKIILCLEPTSVMILHIANELALGICSGEFSFVEDEKNWPVARVRAAASLDLADFRA